MPSPRTRALLLAAATFTVPILGAPSSGFAQAQPKKPPPAKNDPRMAEAKKLFDDGTAAYAKGSYDEAIVAWEKSYEISQKPLIFESIANAYERLGNAKKAREYLLKWREVAPADEAPLLDTRLKNLEGRVAREEEDAKKRAEEEKSRKDLEDKEKARKADEEKARASISIPGVALVSVGGAALIAGIVMDVIAAGKRPPADACKTAAGGTFCLSSAKDGLSSSKTLALAGDVTWAVGAAAAATGVTLIVLKKVMSNKEAPKDAPKASKAKGLDVAWAAPLPSMDPLRPGVAGVMIGAGGVF